MQAIGHAATALILKKKVPAAPLFGLLVATEAIEFLWVGLNLTGIERTEIGTPMRSAADLHLVHMPYSHSIAMSALFATLLGLVVVWRGRQNAKLVAIAMALALFSHIVLDLATHAPDIAFAPFLDDVKYGTGLYANWPLAALGLELLWVALCWWVYRGSKALLGFILVAIAISIPAHSVTLDGGEAMFSGNAQGMVLFVLGQMIVTITLLWLLARRKDRSDEAPTTVS